MVSMKYAWSVLNSASNFTFRVSPFSKTGSLKFWNQLPISNFPSKMVSMNCARFVLNYTSNFRFGASTLPKRTNHKVLGLAPISNFSPKIMLNSASFALHPFSRYGASTFWDLPFSNFPPKMVSMNGVLFVLNYASNLRFVFQPFPREGTPNFCTGLFSNFFSKIASMNCAWFVQSCASPFPEIWSHKVKMWSLAPLHFEF